ncbi:MAG: hypothetical protein SPF21_00975, partial [Candidatus Methanomethylophilaceae archaeon]|nr:hypothetical protein [Candidatus Methanomethylophilaceae archaeon]
ENGSSCVITMSSTNMVKGEMMNRSHITKDMVITNFLLIPLSKPHQSQKVIHFVSEIELNSPDQYRTDKNGDDDTR